MHMTADIEELKVVHTMLAISYFFPLQLNQISYCQVSVLISWSWESFGFPAIQPNAQGVLSIILLNSSALVNNALVR
jgi:hypothetical protein